ncbi:efflux pump azaL [Favolaschia claudopus]|uniref:Efflux pump azaL n=1 Tax=Favolaschia claudopus TaxID=2862362 RepID=A0AAW0C1U2_9AGAR
MSTTDNTEETPLLPASRPAKRISKRTPLPKLQLSVIMLIQICEPLASQSIYPYINQLISELDITGGDEKKVGYYAYVESLFFLGEFTTVLQWSRASDRIGRKPILLIGLFGTGTATLCFGLSRTFITLAISRCVCGLLNGNMGVMKAAMTDLTDSSNRAEAFAFLPIIWAIGASLGPLIGGSLARPHDRFPEIFSGKFWELFPYFLPCLVTGSCVYLSCVFVLAFFKESIPRKKARREDVVATSHDNVAPAPVIRPRPLRELMIFPVLISVSNYIALWFLNMSLGALLPLFLAMPIEIGGLGLPPPKIGVILSAYGIFTAIFQIIFFARMVRRFGEKRVFRNAMITCLPAFALFPIISAVARQSGRTTIVYCLVGLILALGALMDTGFGAIFLFVTASAPKSSRGSVNGIAQSAIALARAIAPSLSTSLFSLSVQHNLLGGNLVYAFFLILSCGALVLARGLPAEVWPEEDDEI